mmetsp:Transcript_39090/g.93392  ORF Transcript_39090/g.93392 Transcript_39090/m.93392 type:complete len:227 (-) Transcript_39090:201-881(-)
MEGRQTQNCQSITHQAPNKEVHFGGSVLLLSRYEVRGVFTVGPQNVVTDLVVNQVHSITDDPLAVQFSELLLHPKDVRHVAIIRQRHLVTVGLVEQRLKHDPGERAPGPEGFHTDFFDEAFDRVRVLHNAHDLILLSSWNPELVHESHIIEDDEVVVEVEELQRTHQTHQIVHPGAQAPQHVQGDHAVVPTSELSHGGHLSEDRLLIHVNPWRSSERLLRTPEGLA